LEAQVTKRLTASDLVGAQRRQEGAKKDKEKKNFASFAPPLRLRAFAVLVLEEEE
jgi:hypothetical protein